ncbi:MAG: hypothetical protein ACTHWJ_04640 [Flaviflexus sp.]|uniref:hypothetical protein n=1 Tax=Flaviflexus sp. TaxID=1969482 RepID=UPI003F90CB64
MESLATIVNWVAWGVSILAIVGVLIVAAMMMIKNRRGEGGESAGQLGWVLFGAVLATAAGPIVSALT